MGGIELSRAYVPFSFASGLVTGILTVVQLEPIIRDGREGDVESNGLGQL
jgi:hypothetical protein